MGAFAVCDPPQVKIVFIQGNRVGFVGHLRHYDNTYKDFFTMTLLITLINDTLHIFVISEVIYEQSHFK